MSASEIEFKSVNSAFSKQSVNYDLDDERNIVLRDMRRQVYTHVSEYLQPQSHILELNAGTGIDASHFVQQGHFVHATDLSDGMIAQIRSKIKINSFENKLTCQQLSYDELDKLKGEKYDYVFSNFGGLNCIDDLKKVTKHLSQLLKDGAHITWVIMPPVCPWELLWFFKGNVKQAFRRFNKDGVMAHLEGEYFKTYYHSLSQIKKAFGSDFKLIKAEGLCTFSPPPASNSFALRYRKVYKLLKGFDSILRSTFPFNHWGDHIIITFKLVPLTQ